VSLPTSRHTSRSARVLNYPGHCPGIGLLLLRGTVGITVAVRAWLFIASIDTDLVGALPVAVLFVCGIALAVGIITPVCSTLIALGYAMVLLTPVGGVVLPPFDSEAAILGLAATTALRALGPGAFSLDARLFGHRQIFIPAKADERAG
jgi:hypothetical protein